MGRYYEYLEENDVELNTLSIEDIKRHKLQLTDDNGTPKERHTVLKCMIFDTAVGSDTYHFSEGNWYKVDASYISKLQAYLDPYCSPIALPEYDHATEGLYNLAAATDSIICLDLASISPPLQTQVEPCDLYEVVNGRATFRHLKVSTLSSQLSHLFNQGINAIELLKAEPDAEKRLRDLLSSKAKAAELPKLVKPLDEGKHHVSFAIITHKDPAKKSLNLPLFSRISLRRCLRSLLLMSVKGSFGFIKDVSPKKAGVKKTRKKKAKKSV